MLVTDHWQEFVCSWFKLIWPSQFNQSGEGKKERKAFTTKNLQKFPIFSGCISPRTETTQNNSTSVRSLPAQSGSAEVHKHFLFHFFYKKATNIFLAFQKAPGLEYILFKCQQRNLLIIQKALFLSKLGIYVETVLWMELQNGPEPQRETHFPVFRRAL